MALLTVAGSGGRGAAASDPWRQASAVPTAPAGAACSGQPHSTGGLRYCGTVAASVEPLPLIRYCFRTYGGATMAAHASGDCCLECALMYTNVHQCIPFADIAPHVKPQASEWSSHGACPHCLRSCVDSRSIAREPAAG